MGYWQHTNPDRHGFQGPGRIDPPPVSADLENGYGDSPEEAVETIRLATGTGLVGASIEDYSGGPDGIIYDFNQSVERVEASVAAAQAVDFPFALTARAENFIRGNPDLDDTIKRLQAFEAAGADVLYAPGLPNLDAIRTVCQSVANRSMLSWDCLTTA